MYTYCLVTPRDRKKNFYYLSETNDIVVGDFVVIPFGYYDEQLFGVVLSVEQYDEGNAPYPPERTKKILRKATDSERRTIEMEETDKNEYIYCWVLPEGKVSGYFYLTEDEDIKAGDTVIIPFGRDDAELFGKVSYIKRCTRKNAPRSPDDTKKILRKADAAFRYEFLTVLPITHKKKTFGYMNTLPGIKVGDYVDIEFRDEIRIAQVLEVRAGSIEEAPENFMGTMEVFRKLDYENSDYIRFLTDLKPLSKEELYKEWPIKPGDPYAKPRLTQTALEAFEKVYQTRLPEEYRHFVTEIANGCSGIYGLDVEEFRKEYIYLKWPFIYTMALPFENCLDDENDWDYECDVSDCIDCNKRTDCPHSDAFDRYGWLDYRYEAGTKEVWSAGDITDRMIVNGDYAGMVFRDDNYTGRKTLMAKTFSEYLTTISTIQG